MPSRLPELLSALAGLASPLALGIATVVFAARRPEYSHLRQTLSELGTIGRPGAGAFNAWGPIPAGLLVMASALAVRHAFGPGKLSFAGAALLVLGGAGLSATAIFPWRGGLPPDWSIFTNRLHVLAAVVGVLALALAPLLFALQARADPALSAWWSGASIGAACLALAFGFWPRPGAYLGLFQRLALLSFESWLCVVCAWVVLHGDQAAG